jgi:hypothetical protein
MTLYHPTWGPLESVLSPAQVSQFSFYGKTDGICRYRHSLTSQQLNIDEATGDFYRFNPDGSYRRIPKQDALSLVGLGAVRCIICDGTKVRTAMRPMAIYNGMPTRVVLGVCDRCDANGNMLPAPSGDAKTEAANG